MGNVLNKLPSNKNAKGKHYFINKDDQVRISLSSDNSLNRNSNDTNINESQSNSTRTKDQEKDNSLISNENNQENKTNVNVIQKERKSFPKKKKRKKNRNNTETYYKNIFKKKSIIGICLNLFFWIWSYLLYLDHSSISKFLSASSNKKIDIIY